MKKNILILTFAMLGLSVSASAQQYDPNKADEMLTKDEAEMRINIFRSRVDSLQNVLNRTNTDITGRRTSMDEAARSLKNCNDEILALLGATEADLANFRQRLGVIANRVAEMQRLSNDELADRRNDVMGLENDLNALRKEKLALIPEHFNRIVALASDIKGLYRTKAAGAGGTYTVGTWEENRDCLWTIAGRSETYNDPFQWPKIWQANTDKIRNPDIIFPGQVLTVPAAGPKTDAELKAERRYFRNKRAQSEKGATTAPAGTNQ